MIPETVILRNRVYETINNYDGRGNMVQNLYRNPKDLNEQYQDFLSRNDMDENFFLKVAGDLTFKYPGIELLRESDSEIYKLGLKLQLVEDCGHIGIAVDCGESFGTLKWGTNEEKALWKKACEEADAQYIDYRKNTKQGRLETVDYRIQEVENRLYNYGNDMPDWEKKDAKEELKSLWEEFESLQKELYNHITSSEVEHEERGIIPESSGEFYLFDKAVWIELLDKSVRKSGDVYVGQQYIDSKIRVLVKKNK